MKGIAEKGRSRRRRCLGRFGRRTVKQMFSAALCVSMVCTGSIGGGLTTLAEEGQVLQLTGSDLIQAVTSAVENGDKYEGAYIFSGEEGQAYADLFDAENLYELNPNVEDTGNLQLKVFAKIDLPEYEEDSYQITGDEELIFLLENSTEKTASGRIKIDELETEIISVVPKSELVDEGSEEEIIKESDTFAETDLEEDLENKEPEETPEAESESDVETVTDSNNTEISEIPESGAGVESIEIPEAEESAEADEISEVEESTETDEILEVEESAEADEVSEVEESVEADKTLEMEEETELSISLHEAFELSAAATESEWVATANEWQDADFIRESADSIVASAFGVYYSSVIVNDETSAVAFIANAEELGLTELDLSAYEPVELTEGVNIIKAGMERKHYQIDGQKAVMISGQEQSEPIVFKDCVFDLSGETVKISGNQDGISYNNGEVVTKLWIGGNVNFENCVFISDGTQKKTQAGFDAVIYFSGGDIMLNDCSLKGIDGNGLFLGLYGSEGSVTFNNCEIATEGNRNGWSYAMYAGSVLKLKNSTMTATGMSIESGNTNVFYSGDNRTGYDAIFIEDSTVDFHDNQAGGFAINNVNIHVKNSQILVNDNKGNACNSGYWIIENSSITMNGNRGGHALSCIGVKMIDSSLEILHNGYAGLYIQSKDSSFIRSTVNISCNGEKLLSYSAGDVWLNGHKATFTDCPSVWLGGVGRKGVIEENNCAEFVAVDLNDFAVDNLKSNTDPILAGIDLDGKGIHTLLLNNRMESDYARGNGESSAGSNDVDLFADDEASMETLLGRDTAKIGLMTDAQLSHHRYDWDGGEIATPADLEHYGAWAYPCTAVCASYEDHTEAHPNSFDCEGTYVYGPLVGLAFDANAGEDSANVTGMPEERDALSYGEGTASPSEIPVRPDDSDEWNWKFTGWYTDRECTQKFDFTSALTNNWTVVYAGWVQEEHAPEPIPDPDPTPDPEPTPDPTPDPSDPGNHGNGSSGGGGGSSVPVTEITPDPAPLAPGPSEAITSVPEVITEEQVPLSPLPKTGEKSGRKEIAAFFSGIFAVLYLGLTRKKKQEQ